MNGDVWRIILICMVGLTCGVAATRLPLRAGFTEKLALATIALYSLRVILALLQGLGTGELHMEATETLLPILVGFGYAVATMANVGTSRKRNDRKEQNGGGLRGD